MNPGALPADDRRFANNPFARALHPARPRTIPQWIALVVVSIAGAIIMAAAFVLPVLFAWGLVGGGVRAGRPGMVAAGVIIAVLYAMVLVRMLRKRR